MKDKDKKIKEERWNSYDIDKTLAKFNIDEPFYGHISSNINKYQTKDLDTAGVSVRNGKMVLYYNEEFFQSLNWKERQGLLIHEFLHLIFNHATSRAKKNKNGNQDKAWLYACDFAVNSLIDESRLPPGGLIPGRWEDIPPEHRHLYSPETLRSMEEFRDMVRSWPKGMSAEWYYEQIDKNRDCFDCLLKGNAISLTDDHEGWEELPSEEKEIAENAINKILEEAGESCNRSKHWGSASSQVQEIINQIIKNSVDWVSFLRLFVGNNLTQHATSTIKKINRRYPYIHPGKKRDRIARVAVCIDQSGSVTDSDLEMFFGELSHLADHTEFTVIPFDANVIEDEIFVWDKGQKMNPRRVAHGGTNFNVPSKWINENSVKFDAAIFMTDGYCSKPIDTKIPRCWVICPSGKLLFETNELKIKMTDT